MKLPQDPIFIVGYPRSGTTLLQRLLVTQPGIFSFPETHYFCVIEKQLQYDRGGNILPSCLDTIFEKIREKMELRFTLAEEGSIRRAVEETTLSSKALFEIITARLLLNLHPDIANITPFRWLEKTPNHALFLDRILEFYPQAQAIHIIRHPVPAVFSRKLKFPFNKEIAVTELAGRWNRMVDKVEDFNRLFPGTIHTLRYEDLVKDMNKEAAAVANFLHIPFDFTRTARLAYKNISDALILPSEAWKLEDINREVTNTNDVYKESISREDAGSIEAIAAVNMKKYGYKPYF